MKRFAMGGLLAVALAGSSAVAADLPRPVYKAPPAAPAFTWTGCYAGGHVGWMKNDSELRAYPSGLFPAATVAAGTFAYDADDKEFTAGVQYGCNKQYGSWVFGIDSSFSWSGLDQIISASHPASAFLVAYNETITQELNWYSTTRGRIGWAHDRWLVFAAGGLASGRIESTYFSPPAGGFSYAGSESKTRYGWTVGGGVEYALSDNWWLRGEYLYIDLGKYSYVDYQSPPVPAGFTWGTDVDTRFHVARLALSYRFTTAGSLWEWAHGGMKY